MLYILKFYQKLCCNVSNVTIHNIMVRVKRDSKRWGHKGCNAFDSNAWNRSYYTIVPLTPKGEEPKITRPDGLIGKNPCRNATVLL